MNSNTLILLSGLFVQRFNVDTEKSSPTNIALTVSESVKKTTIASVYSHINCLLGHCTSGFHLPLELLHIILEVVIFIRPQVSEIVQFPLENRVYTRSNLSSSNMQVSKNIYL